MKQCSRRDLYPHPLMMAAALLVSFISQYFTFCILCFAGFSKDTIENRFSNYRQYSKIVKLQTYIVFNRKLYDDDFLSLLFFIETFKTDIVQENSIAW